MYLYLNVSLFKNVQNMPNITIIKLSYDLGMKYLEFSIRYEIKSNTYVHVVKVCCKIFVCLSLLLKCLSKLFLFLFAIQLAIKK